MHLPKGLVTKQIKIKKIEEPSQREELKKYILPSYSWKY